MYALNWYLTSYSSAPEWTIIQAEE